MTREEFIGWCEERFALTKNDIYEFGQLYDEVTKLHWISVKVQKPKLKHSDDTTKYSDTVIVTNGKYRTSARWLYYTLGGWYGWYDGDEELKDVTHWMPMPSVEHLRETTKMIEKGGEE